MSRPDGLARQTRVAFADVKRQLSPLSLPHAGPGAQKRTRTRMRFRVTGDSFGGRGLLDCKDREDCAADAATRLGGLTRENPRKFPPFSCSYKTRKFSSFITGFSVPQGIIATHVFSVVLLWLLCSV